MSNHSPRSHDDPEQEAEIHLRDTKNNPSDRLIDLLAIFPVYSYSCVPRVVRLVLASSSLQLT